jgi:SAM-dependent methyltransferase
MDDSEIQILDRLEAKHWWYVARKVILEKWISTLEPRSRILDLGSATGANSQFIRNLGFECASIEFSTLGVAIQKSKGLEVTQGDARSLPHVSDSFDAIICLDVMEHIVEHDAVASEIHRVLRSGGKFLISVPHGKKLWSAHDVAVNHVRRYETEEMLKVLREAGLKVVDVWGTNSFLKPVILAVKAFTKGSNLKESSKLLNSAFYFLTALEEKWIPTKFRLKHGVTLWVTGEKPRN